MCRRYSQYHDQQAGENAVKYLTSQGAPLSPSVAIECFKLVLESKSSQLSPSQDAIISELARKNLEVRLYMVLELQASTTEFFDNIYERGDLAANCLRAVVLEVQLWTNEALRLRVQEDLFQLFIAKLMESGHDHDGRALKGIVLLLMADPSRLKEFVDEDAFDAILTSLDLQLPNDVRGQATLVVSKFLEVSESDGQSYIDRFITSHVRRQKAEDLVLAFSAASALFSIPSANIASLFRTEGFLPSLVPLLDRKLKSSAVNDAFLALLSSACMDATCRTAVAAHCSPYLSHKVSNGTERQNALAATVLAKLRTAGGLTGSGQPAMNKTDDVSDLVDLFQSNLRCDSKQEISNSVEGLAYTSLNPQVKEQLSKDAAFLKRLLSVLESNDDTPEILIGGLSIIANMTKYAPNLSEEQKRVSQLKAYANASKLQPPSPLEDDAHVDARCARILNAGIVSTVVKIDKTVSSSSSQLTDGILLSLTRSPQSRGKIAQQGAIKLLISHAQKPEGHDAAHALAQILISIDPTLIFPASSKPHITDAIPPLVSLLQPSNSISNPLASTSNDDNPRDLLPTFEALLALTNLASHPDKTTATSIVKSAFDTVLDDILLSSNKNTLLRRAATELICNLVTCSDGIAKFADTTTSASLSHAKRRTHLLLAMADVDDGPTRCAAGGALAMLTEFPEFAAVLLTITRGVEIILSLASEHYGDESEQGNDPSIVLRGLVCLDNLLASDDKPQVDAVKAKLKELNAAASLKKTALRFREDAQVLGLCVGVIKKL